MAASTPGGVWAALAAGNQRFLDGAATHPHQDRARVGDLAAGQAPVAAVLGCSDSRVAPEVVLDQGLGDLFVVRNAGQVADAGAVASLEYAVAALDASLVVVLAHERCGAVQAALDAGAGDAPPLPPLIAAHVAAVRPAVDAARRAAAGARPDAGAVGRAHLEATVAALLATSEIMSAGVADGSLAIVGALYRLADGSVQRHVAIGAEGGPAPF